MGQNADAWILKLPNELLGPILYHSTRDPKSEGQEYRFKYIHKTPPSVLTKVCRRFHELGTPLLYASLNLECPTKRLVSAYEDEYSTWVERGEGTKGEMLHRTLGENPSLRLHCQSLIIDIGFSTPFKNLCLAADCIAWLKATTSLKIRFNVPSYGPVPRGDDTSNLKIVDRPHNYCYLLSAVSHHLHNLQELYLGEGLTRDLFALPIVVKAVAGLNHIESFRKLDVWGIDKIPDERHLVALRAQAGTAPFTDLIVSQFIASHQALKFLVMWPHRLEKFKFWVPSTAYYSGEFAESHYTLGSLQDVLWNQRESLTHIHLRELYTSGIEGFDLTKFTKLKDLHLSHDLTGTDTTLIKNLVAPNLQVFHWDQTLEDQQCGEQLDYFGQAEEDWLQAFSAAAIERRSALRRIEIIFHPECNVSRENPSYPWDRMDRIARDIRPYGIKLTYNTPTISREAFWAKVKEHEGPGYWDEFYASIHE